MNAYMRNFSNQRTWRVILGILLIVSLSAGAGVFSALASDAFGGYLIDGTIPDANTFQFDDPFGSVDELGPVNASSTKLGVIHSANPPMLAFTNPNAQVDLRRVWLDTTIDDHDKVWLYFAWERDSSNGSGVIMFEFQQDAAPDACDYSVTDQITPITPEEQALIDACNPWANRQPGDFIIVWDQAGKKIVLIKRTFVAGADTNGNLQWDKGEPLVLTAGDILVDNVDAKATYSNDKFFGEAAINLSTTVFPPTPTSCFSVANIIPGTATGNSDTADYKDTVLADYTDDIAISNCGELTVEKVTSDGGSGTFPYTVDRSAGGALMYPDNNHLADPSVTENQISSILTTSNETNEWTDLLTATDYQLAEGAVGPSYALDRIECVVDGDTANPYVLFPLDDDDYSATFPIAASSITYCTITNELQQGTLILEKTVDNGTTGGTLTETDFPVYINGVAASWGSNTIDSGNYTVSEDSQPGYLPSGWGTDCAADGTIYVPPGETKTCSITNTAQQAYITVVKIVDNGSTGGTAQPDDFDLTLEGNPVLSGVAVAVTPGTYTAAETQLAGYDFDGFSGACDSSGDVTVTLGESKTCYLTNSAQQASITVVKIVDQGTTGGTAQPDDFDLTLEGNPVLSGVSVSVAPGTYTAGETQLPGYTFDGFSGDCDGNGDVTVALGDSKTCTLTNTAQQATITVVKIVDQGNTGGTAQPDDFNLTLEGDPVLSGVAVAVDPGTYTAGETLLSGYTFDGFSDDCDINGDVTVALGESKTCTLTNSAQQATITVFKVVENDNGLNAQPDDFNLTLEGVPVNHGVAVNVDPGTYTAGETLLPYYSFAGFSGDCDVNGDISVALGENKTCTLTNQDEPADPSGTTTMSWELHDSLTITGLRSGAPDAATALVTFSLYSDAACSVQVGEDEDIVLVGSSAETVAGVEVSDPGTYYWRVEYSGDLFNNGFTTDCGSEITTIGETVDFDQLSAEGMLQERAFAASTNGSKK